MNANLGDSRVLREGAAGDEVLPEAASEYLECPSCGEARLDHIVWIDSETVRCTTCDAEYAVWAGDRG